MEIDFSYLETVSDGDLDFIAQFVTTFDETVTSLTKKMEEELLKEDFENLGKSAHQLKPSAKMLGLISGSQLEELQDNPQSANAALLASIKEDCIEGLKLLQTWAKEKGVDL